MKAVVVHAGARDSYQVAQALWEAGLLEKLVTNVYWRKWAQRTYSADIPFERVRLGMWAFVHFWLKKFRHSWHLERASDRSLGRLAKKVASRNHAAVLAYSYYAADAFRGHEPIAPARILFQLHPHPLSVRRLLADELELVPEARDSLRHEAELALTPTELEDLASETNLADAIVAASSFTLGTLLENGVGAKPTSVVPYGVNRAKFPPRDRAPKDVGALRIVWLGQICQRKGLSYLLDAVRQVSKRHIKVLLRGFGLADWNLLKGYRDLSIDVRQGLTTEEVVQDLHSADIFVLPSLAEGFGHSILEAMSCGLPVITTAHTCGADVVKTGVEGFLVPIRDSGAIAQHLDWGLRNRLELADMGRAAASKADRFTWASFREGIRRAYIRFIGGAEEAMTSRSCCGRDDV